MAHDEQSANISHDDPHGASKAIHPAVSTLFLHHTFKSSLPRPMTQAIWFIWFGWFGGGRGGRAPLRAVPEPLYATWFLTLTTPQNGLTEMASTQSSSVFREGLYPESKTLSISLLQMRPGLPMKTPNETKILEP